VIHGGTREKAGRLLPRLHGEGSFSGEKNHKLWGNESVLRKEYRK
jgi:hypothetical protein